MLINLCLYLLQRLKLCFGVMEPQFKLSIRRSSYAS